MSVHIAAGSSKLTLASVDPFEILLTSDHQEGFQRSFEFVRLSDISHSFRQQIPQFRRDMREGSSTIFVLKSCFLQFQSSTRFTKAEH